jgi:hypothetical protein
MLVPIIQMPQLISILEKNTDKIDWKYLSRNPSAIHLLEKNMDKIEWFYLGLNTNVKTKEINDGFRKELCEKIFEPKRMIRLAGDMPLWDYFEYYE